MMGWESRNYGSEGEGGGGFRAALRRVFGDGENPLSWSLPLYTAWGIRVRIHIVFIIMVVGELLWSLAKDRMGPGQMAVGMTSLFVLVLLHEYGHCIACRRVGGTADQILMWPLGGLATCAPPHNWKADLITTIGGPAVNFILWPVFAAGILSLGIGWSAIIFNPFAPRHAISEVAIAMGGQGPVLRQVARWLWWLYYTNAILFLFNMSLVMYPFDAGRILHALMWRKMGHRRATAVAVKAGLVTAVVLFVLAIPADDSGRLMGVAVFGGITCWIEARRLRMATGDPALEAYDFERGFKGFPEEDDDEKPDRRSERRRQKEEEDQQELDRILAKIASSGMGSLTKAEKRWLERATERRRRV